MPFGVLLRSTEGKTGKVVVSLYSALVLGTLERIQACVITVVKGLEGKPCEDTLNKLGALSPDGKRWR